MAMIRLVKHAAHRSVWRYLYLGLNNLMASCSSIYRCRHCQGEHNSLLHFSRRRDCAGSFEWTGFNIGREQKFGNGARRTRINRTNDENLDSKSRQHRSLFITEVTVHNWGLQSHWATARLCCGTAGLHIGCAAVGLGCYWLRCGTAGLRLVWVAVELGWSWAGLRLGWAAVRLDWDTAGLRFGCVAVGLG